jgi:hypothetical protein
MGKHANALEDTWNSLMLPLATVPARVKTILEITTTVGAAVDVAESCMALTVIAPNEELEAEVKQYMTSRLLVCQALNQGQ